GDSSCHALLLRDICQPRARHTPFVFPLTRPPPTPPLFPYTTLFRSGNTHRQPIRHHALRDVLGVACFHRESPAEPLPALWSTVRSEEHTSELQSLTNLVCRLLLEKKKHPAPPRSAARVHCQTAPAHR